MPLQRGYSRAVISGNVGEMLRAGHPAAQAVAAALRTADQSRKGKPMDGIRQHKNMATSGRAPGEGGNFGVEPFHQVNGGGRMGEKHPTTREEYGTQSKMLHDHERGIGKHVSRGKGMMPAQRHPDHGPHHHGEDFGVGSFPR